MPFAKVYPLYITKVEKKWRTKTELDEVIEWLTGYDALALKQILEEDTNFEDFFGEAKLNPNRTLIIGTICGYKIQDMDDWLMKEIRYLDKLVDELAKGKAMEKILRK